MIEFLKLLSRKVPPGFSFSFHLTVLGFKIHVKHDKSGVGVTVPVNHVEVDSLTAAQSANIDQLVLVDTINKIKKNPNYDRPKKH